MARLVSSGRAPSGDPRCLSAKTVSSTREWIASLVNVCLRWASTVCRERVSRWAISLFENPWQPEARSDP